MLVVKVICLLMVKLLLGVMLMILLVFFSFGC